MKRDELIIYTADITQCPYGEAEVYTKDDADAVMDAYDARIKELEAEQKQLKADLEGARSYKHLIKMNNRNLTTENKRLKKEIAKLKCLALHLFKHLANHEASEWWDFCDSVLFSSRSHIYQSHAERWARIAKGCGEAYLKAKKELMEGK